MGGCASGALWRGTPSNVVRPHSTQPFARPLISESEIVSTRVGLRPYRAAGFVVRGERVGDKILIHNYGHGGAGMTLSWGSSTLAVQELPDIADKRAVVLGCGVMGLTTARLLQSRGWRVTIMAKALPPHTTSDIAGGHWAPTGVYNRREASAAFTAQFQDALRLSHAMFSTQINAGYGVYWRENYHMAEYPLAGNDNTYYNRWPDYFRDNAFLQPHEHPFLAPYVARHLSLMIEPAIFLPRLMADFREAGGAIVQREIAHIDELQRFEEPVIFNCTGLGAKDLVGDAALTPVRGQLVMLPPDARVDFNTHGGGSGGSGLLYMFPRADGIVLGGTFEQGASHLEPDAETTARIVEGHRRMAGQMRIA